jgi:LPXTG-motif cell wall-anchored protein
VLPSTGGASLIALGAGLLLVAGGLLARRIVR